jgi:hypothetical protein
MVRTAGTARLALQAKQALPARPGPRDQQAHPVPLVFRGLPVFRVIRANQARQGPRGRKVSRVTART